jgi:hypothetical protein
LAKNEKQPKRNPAAQKTKISKPKLLSKEKKTHLSAMLDHSFCLEATVPTSVDMKKIIDSKKTPGKNETINGVALINEAPALIEAFGHLTTALDVYGMHEDPENQKNIQTAYAINPECNKVECAVDKIWGKNMGLKMLYIILHHSYNTSELAFAYSSRFNPDELDDVLLALEDLPSFLIPLGKPNQRLAHFARHQRPPLIGPRAIANALVMLLDSWSNQPRKARRYTVYHELCHNIGTLFNSMDEDQSWLLKSDWIKKGEDWFHGHKACFASPYAGSADPGEDWAESLASYRYNSNNFKQRCPDKYNFLKDVIYKDKEYLSNKSCTETDQTDPTDSLQQPPAAPDEFEEGNEKIEEGPQQQKINSI